LCSFQFGRRIADRASPVRAVAGTFVGLLALALADRLLGPHLGGAQLIAPLAATALLVFAVPASPLAQPWPVLGGNLVSAVVGVACLQQLPQAVWVAPLAVAGAIAAMALLRCLHPPGGAVALAAAAGGGADSGSHFVLVSVGLNCLLLLAGTILLGRLIGLRYPHRVPPAEANSHATADPAPAQRVGFTRADIEVALRDTGEGLDVSPGDLDALFRRVEIAAHRRLHADVTCGQIMSRDLVGLAATDDGARPAAMMRAHGLRSLPVLDQGGYVIGLVDWTQLGPGSARRSMRPVRHVARPETPVDDLLPALTDGETHEVMILDATGRLVGIVTTKDVLAALYRVRVARLAAA
jgi:CBS domain-containing membrane protein